MATSPIIPGDILCGEIIKVLTLGDNEEEEESWAKVVENNGSYLFVTYLIELAKTYKSARVHSLEPRVQRVDYECVTEHHDGVFNLEDIDLVRIGTNMYVFSDDIDSEDEGSDSDIYSDSDDESDDEYDTADGFVVPDTEVDGPVLPPPDAEQIDREWREWVPRTTGERRFREMVDRIELNARIQADNLNNFSPNV